MKASAAQLPRVRKIFCIEYPNERTASILQGVVQRSRLGFWLSVRNRNDPHVGQQPGTEQSPPGQMTVGFGYEKDFVAVERIVEPPHRLDQRR